MATDEPVPPDPLPAPLVEELDALQLPELRAVRAYVDDLIEHRRTPIRELILSDAAGDVVGLEDHGAYALVRKRPPDLDEGDADSQSVALYHVTRERRPSGEEALRWSFQGDARDPTIGECERCGGPVDERAACPRCGTENADGSDPGDDR